MPKMTERSKRFRTTEWKSRHHDDRMQKKEGKTVKDSLRTLTSERKTETKTTPTDPDGNQEHLQSAINTSPLMYCTEIVKDALH